MSVPKSKNKSSPATNIADWHLWSEVTRTVSPLPVRNTKITGKIIQRETLTQSELSQQRHLAARSGRQKPPSVQTIWSPLDSPQHGRLTGASIRQNQLPSMEPRMHRRVRRGQLPINATIDLHGLHQDAARSALYRFIQSRLAFGDRTLLVITGKGLKKNGMGAIEQKGVLRNMLPLWLKEPGLAPFIAGFEVSARQHGGEGAYYVRLRQDRQYRGAGR